MSFIQFQFRRGLASAWTSANPILADGELAIEKDTRQFKIGDGANTWSQLGYGGIVGPQGTLYPNVEFDVSFNANVFVGRDVSFSGNLFVKRDISVNGNVVVGNSLICKPTTINAGGSLGTPVSIVAVSNVVELSGADGTNYFTLQNTGAILGQQITFICRTVGSAGLFLNAASSFLINGSTVTQVRFLAVGQSMTVAFNGSTWTVLSWSGVSFQGGSMTFSTYGGSGDINMVPSGKLAVIGFTQISGNLSVINDISLSGRFIGLSDASINGNVVSGQLRTTGNTIVSGNLFVTRDVSLGQLVTVVGNTFLRGNLFVDRDVSFGQQLTVVGNTTLSGNTFASRFVALGDVSLNSNLFVGVDTSLNGNITVFGRAGFGGASTVDATYAVNVGGNINLSGNIYQNGVLFVGSGGSGVDYNADFSLNANLRVGRDLSVNGVINVPRLGLQPRVMPTMAFTAEYMYDFEGSVVNSGSGVALTAASNGTPTYTTGKNGLLALTLNAASTQYVTLGATGTQYQFTSNGFSVAFWIKTTSATTATFLDFFQGTGDRVKIYFDTSGGSTYLRIAVNLVVSSILIANINDGAWRHIVFTLTSAGSGQVYVNGVAAGGAVAFGVYPTLLANKTVYIGISAVVPSDLLTGSIDQLIFANRVFNSGEPSKLFNFVPSASLDTSVSNANLQITGYNGNITSYGLGSVMPYSGFINVVSARNTVSVGDRVPIFTARQSGGSSVAWDTGATLAMGASSDMRGAELDLILSYSNNAGLYSQAQVVSFVADSATTGRVGINVAAPTAALDVAGNVVLNGAITQNLASYSGLTSKSQIGYQGSDESTTAVSNSGIYTALVNTGSLPAGIWMVEGSGEYNSSIGGHNRVYSLSTSGSTTEDNTRKVYINCGSAQKLRYSIHSTFVLTDSSTIYFMGAIKDQTGTPTITNSYNILRWTRIG